MRAVRQWVGETAGGLPRQFWYLWSATLINRMGSFVLIVLAIYLTQVRGFSESYAGLVIGLWGAGSAVGTLVGGVLADRWGRKPTFLTALYASAAMMLVFGFVEGPVAIAIAVVLLGLVGEGARPAMSALMVDIVGQRDRVRAFSLIYWVINLAFAFSAAVAGFVVGVDVRLLFLVNAASTVAAATFLAFTVREPVRVRRPAASNAPSPVEGGGLTAVLRDRVFLAFAGANLLTALIFMQHLSTLPMAMSRDGLAASTYGTVIALNGVLIVVGQLFVTRLLKRLRRTTALAVALVVLGIGFGLTAFADTADVLRAHGADLDRRRDAPCPVELGDDRRPVAGAPAGALPGRVLALLVGRGLPGAAHRRSGASVRRAHHAVARLPGSRARRRGDPRVRPPQPRPAGRRNRRRRRSSHGSGPGTHAGARSRTGARLTSSPLWRRS